MTILHGDCLDLMAEMEPNSVDAIVTDPPYGLSKEPDIAEVLTHWLAGDDYQHSSGGFMGKTWDSFVPGPSYWKEAYRVLKPGAHLVAFGGTRTVDLLTIALRIAGFEIRDSLVFLQGQGFPKSLDVSKAIDKARNEDVPYIRAVCRFLRAVMDAHDLRSKDMTQHFGDCHPRLIDHWAARDTDSQPAVPTWEQWVTLKDALNFGDEMDAEVWRLNGRKGTPGENWEKREVTGTSRGTSKVGGMTEATPWSVGAKQQSIDVNITAPATPEAEQWQGWGTALKPGHEPICLARKPIAASNIAANVLAYGTGAINIDACRVDANDIDALQKNWDRTQSQSAYEGSASMGGGLGMIDLSDRKPSGRWPANVILDETAAGLLDAMSGERKGAVSNGSKTVSGMNGTSTFKIHEREQKPGYADTGGASRFFLTAPIDDPDAEHTRFLYTAKASRAERNAGLDGMPERNAGVMVGRNADARPNHVGLDGDGTFVRAQNHHPTVKPLSLMRWLVRLVCPPGGIILDPFTGSGSTGCAAALEGFDFIGCEREAEYVEIARARIAHWTPKDAPQLALALETFDTPASKGRWPANVLLDETAAQLLDEQSGKRTSPSPYVQKSKSVGIYGAEKHHDRPSTHHGDTGGASRFFFTANADQEETA